MSPEKKAKKSSYRRERFDLFLMIFLGLLGSVIIHSLPIQISDSDEWLAVFLIVPLYFFITWVIFPPPSRGCAKRSTCNYYRIELWLRQKYGFDFDRSMSHEAIRAQLLSILDAERQRLKNADLARKGGEKLDAASGKKVSGSKSYDVEKRLKGFKDFIDSQDYFFLLDHDQPKTIKELKPT